MNRSQIRASRGQVVQHHENRLRVLAARVLDVDSNWSVRHSSLLESRFTPTANTSAISREIGVLILAVNSSALWGADPERRAAAEMFVAEFTGGVDDLMVEATPGSRSRKVIPGVLPVGVSIRVVNCRKLSAH